MHGFSSTKKRKELKSVVRMEGLGDLAGKLAGEEAAEAPPAAVISSFDLAGVAAAIREGRCTNVIVMAGAGVSTSAGIPDFRTPGTGLYDNLAKYNLPEPTAVFDIGFFRENPAPFYQLVRVSAHARVSSRCRRGHACTQAPR